MHPQTCLCLSFQVILEGKNIEEGFGIAFRVLQVWKNLIQQAILLQSNSWKQQLFKQKPFPPPKCILILHKKNFLWEKSQVQVLHVHVFVEEIKMLFQLDISKIIGSCKGIKYSFSFAVHLVQCLNSGKPQS